jgi:iron complex outermembrane receptor protein
VERYTVQPRLFVYLSEQTQANFGVNTLFENRLGGDMLYLKGKNSSGHTYFERNQTKRLSTQFSMEHRFSQRSKLNIRNSYSHFARMITIPDYVFDGIQNSTFSEINGSYTGTQTEWVVGINFWTDMFKERQRDKKVVPLDYEQLTGGIFVQNLSAITDRFSIESGLRGDYVADYGFALLPRLSALFKINRHWTSRVGGGLGYKTPAIFTEESERIQYQNVLPVSSDINRLERSYGMNADVNYHTLIADKITFSVNQLFFYTRLNNPLRLLFRSDGNRQFNNLDGYADTKGVESNVKLGYENFKFYLGYTFTDAVAKENVSRYQYPLTPKHRINAVLMYEVEEKWRAGLEAYYNSSQLLTDGSTGKACWVFGAMIERMWEHFSVFINFENFTDTRQTRFGSIYSGTVTNPVFKDIYAPLDGFVFNMGIKLRF